MDVRAPSTTRYHYAYALSQSTTNLYYDTPTGPYTNVLDLYLFPSMSHRHSAHLQRQSNKEVPIDRIWNTVESVRSAQCLLKLPGYVNEDQHSSSTCINPNPNPYPLC